MKKIFPILALAMFSSNLGMGIVAPLLSIYAQNMGGSGVLIGLVMASYGIASIFSTPFFGRLADRRGRKYLLVGGLFCYSLISVAYIFASNIYFLALVRLMHGAVGGAVLPIANAYIGDASPKGEEGKWMGYSNAAFFAGFGAGPLLGGAISQYFSMTATFSIMAGLNFAAFLIVLLLLPKIAVRTDRKTDAPRPSFKMIFQSNTIRGCFFYQMTSAIGQGSFSTFMPVFAAARGLSLTLIGIIIATAMSLMSLLAPVGGHLADRFNKRILVPAGCLIVALVLAFIPSSWAFWQIMLLVIFMALGNATASPSILALGVSAGRYFGMGTIMGVLTMGMNIGFAIGPLIAGEMADLGNTNYAFYFAAAIVFLGIIPFMLFTRMGKKTEAKEEKEIY